MATTEPVPQNDNMPIFQTSAITSEGVGRGKCCSMASRKEPSNVRSVPWRTDVEAPHQESSGSTVLSLLAAACRVDTSLPDAAPHSLSRVTTAD